MSAPPTTSLLSPVVIAGAGQAGALLAIYLARQGHDVTIYESRPDLRRHDVGGGRSINLALATRGIVPLIDVGVISQVDAITIPMRGRMIHAVGDPTPVLQPYGTREHEVIHSVSRSDLNAILLEAAEATGRVAIEFDRHIDRIDFDDSTIRFHDGTMEQFGTIFGADGAGSRVREAMADMGPCVYRTEWLDHSYKELTLPAGTDGSHQLDPNALHIWPRGEFMLIALANPGGDFTITLFAPTSTFDELSNLAGVDRFFDTEFADFAALVPDLTTQFAENPTGSLGTIRADGWSFDDRAVLVGDAAHAIVPFHGQGMNAAMESVRALDRHLRASPNDIARAFQNYGDERKADADAIADMALDNYLEMRSGVVDPDYLKKRSLALELERRHPELISPRYNMVMFSTMPYAEVRARAVAQAEIISSALTDASTDVDRLVEQLAPLPDLDALVDPKALSTS